MKLKEKITDLKSSKSFKIKLFFTISAVTFIFLTYIFFLTDPKKNDFFNTRLKYITYVLKNLERNFIEEDLVIKFENSTYTTNKEEPILLENFDTRISNKKNLIYISKSAEDKDFKEKESLAIMNSKEFKIDVQPQTLIYPIESIQGISNQIDKSNISEFNKLFYPGSDRYNSAGLSIILIVKSIEILFYIVIANLILPSLVYLVLLISGYKNLNSTNFKDNSLAVIGIFLALKPAINTYLFEPSFISLLLIMTVITSILEKNSLEKN